MIWTGTRHCEHPRLDRQGFALMGVLVAVAVLAILAGVLGPLAFRQMQQARERSTLQEMNALEDGLLAFFNDTGRFPSDAEGLAALTTDPGAAGWQGPYMVGERYIPVDEISSDAFGLPYLYDLDPVTNPPGASDLILVSGGVNRSVSTGQVNGIWTIGDDEDDLRILVNSGPTNRDKTLAARDEMQAISDAAQEFFQDNAGFPTDSASLDVSYLDGSFSGQAFVDPWLKPYLIEIDSSLPAPTMVIRSRGPNRTDDGGAGDDITLDVGSVLPGRKSTYYMVRIAQAVVNAKPATVLTGDWIVDHANLELAGAFARDGWGHPYELALSTRTVVSAGPDADYFTPEDNIPPGVVPDDDAPVSGELVYVDGSAVVSSQQCDAVEFDIRNESTSPITLTAVTVTWTTPTAYFERIVLGNRQVFNRRTPRLGSGETATYSPTVTIAAGETTTVAFEKFRRDPSGGNSRVNMSNTDFLVTFSNGSSLAFSTPSCGGGNNGGGNNGGGNNGRGGNNGNGRG